MRIAQLTIEARRRSLLALALGMIAVTAVAWQPPGPARTPAADTRVPIFTFRILVQNIYGRNENDCSARHRELVRRIRAADPPYHLVALGEHWPSPFSNRWICDDTILTKEMAKDKRYKYRALSFPEADDFPRIDGDNSVFSMFPIQEFYPAPFVNNEEIEMTGFGLTRIEFWPGMGLDLWTTHLNAGVDHCDRFCREEQLADLSASVSIMSGTPDVRGGGYPVLVVGDFNIGGPANHVERILHERNPKSHRYPGNDGYDDILLYFKNPRDLWLENTPLNYLKPGFTIDCRLNTLQKNCTHRERIDYLLVPTHRDFVDSRFDLKMERIEVVRWKTPAGESVSDHFGLDATLSIVPK